jgi:hypothetical protein
MRGKKAKAIRKKVYGDMSQRTKEYKVFKFNPDVLLIKLRRKYQDLKKTVQNISRLKMLPE